ncbi:lipase 3-like [Phlebotomus argentipes]|uniref:lipase 3-like n=1 Tax=Phlebotomus argentipes TaxID=94469 RepID=UPI002892FBF8|nr:lipase 3-like [Phlebotomus argentipes]
MSGILERERMCRLLIIFCVILASEAAFPEETDERNKFPTIMELVEANGYPLETHIAQTADGYLLTMYRIPHGKAQETSSYIDRPVAFLQHGLLTSAADWIINGAEGLAYLLADEGYDVWMGNARGNTHSRNHIYLNPKSKAFWDFSWHEIGVFDIPAMIDYTLRETGKKKLSYVGHSQGTTVLFVTLSLRPEYNAKIDIVNSLAPVAYMPNIKSPFIRYFAPFVFIIDKITSLLGMNEFAPSTPMMQLGGYFLCKDNSIFQELCANSLFLIAGFNSEQLNRTVLPLMLAFTPAGASSKQLVHYGQLFNSGKFRQFDYGWLGNLRKYGSFQPPEYPLEAITAPIALHFSDNDWLSAVSDVQHLQSRLRSVVGAFRVPLAAFNHLDFIFAIDVKSLLYDRVISLMNRFICP